MKLILDQTHADENIKITLDVVFVKLNVSSQALDFTSTTIPDIFLFIYFIDIKKMRSNFFWLYMEKMYGSKEGRQEEDE